MAYFLLVMPIFFVFQSGYPLPSYKLSRQSSRSMIESRNVPLLQYCVITRHIDFRGAQSPLAGAAAPTAPMVPTLV